MMNYDGGNKVEIITNVVEVHSIIRGPWHSCEVKDDEYWGVFYLCLAKVESCGEEREEELWFEDIFDFREMERHLDKGIGPYIMELDPSLVVMEKYEG